MRNVRIVVTNCNTTQEMTEEIVRGARAAAGPGTTVTGLTPAWGPESAEGWLDSLLSAAAVMDALRTYDGAPYDAVVMVEASVSTGGRAYGSWWTCPSSTSPRPRRIWRVCWGAGTGS